jgi:hypothetical protein
VKRSALAALLAAGPLVGLACGGTTGREGLPMPEVDGGSDATAALDATILQDARAFDVDILYADRPLPDIQVPDVGSDAPADAPKGGLGPCVSEAGLTASDGGPDCVTCNGNASGICSPTEAQFVQYDIDNKLVTAPGPDALGDGGTSSANQTCYECLWQNSCIDDTVNGDVGHECEDTVAFQILNGMMTTSMECEAVISCILGSGFGPTQCTYNGSTIGVSNCYCGTDPASACNSGNLTMLVTAGVNGKCAKPIADGLGFPLGDGTDIGPNLFRTSTAAGRADQILGCAHSNDCEKCL